MKTTNSELTTTDRMMIAVTLVLNIRTNWQSRQSPIMRDLIKDNVTVLRKIRNSY